jgi:hypothetical protein
MLKRVCKFTHSLLRSFHISIPPLTTISDNYQFLRHIVHNLRLLKKCCTNKPDVLDHAEASLETQLVLPRIRVVEALGVNDYSESTSPTDIISVKVDLNRAILSHVVC